MGKWIGSPEHQFNTQGMTKCSDCGDYYPEGWGSHGASCPRAPKED
jgi:hypothetical protein